MPLNLEEIKVLIIEDDADDFNSLKSGLKSDLDIEQVFPENWINIKEKSVSELFRYYSELIIENNIDIIFFDLALRAGEDASNSSGAKLIVKFLNHSEEFIKYIPKIICTGADNVDSLDELAEQEVKTVIIKPEHRDEFGQILVDEKLNITIPEFVRLFRELKKNIQIKEELQKVNDNLLEIKTITRTIATSLPKITDKSKAKKLMKEWEESIEFKEAMGEYFPNSVESLFTKLNKKVEEFKSTATDNISEAILEQFTEYFNEEAEIEDDDTKLIKYFKYAAYVTEEIGSFIHK